MIDDYWRKISFFDRYPVTPGHMLIMPKRHVNGMENLNKEEWLELYDILEEVIKYVMSLSPEEKMRVYRNFYENPINEKSKWFAGQMLNNKFIYKKTKRI